MNETLDQSDHQSKLLVDNNLEAMNADVTNFEIVNHCGTCGSNLKSICKRTKRPYYNSS